MGLKKLKEDEIAQKLSEIKKHGDFDDLQGMDEMKDILDEDFDLEKHEELMNKMYGDEYYGEIGDGTEKPVWEDDELLDFDYGEENHHHQTESRKERRQREREEKRKK